jgi:raffinose/stachyose/melibiose transport system substrate-binding protein
MTTHVSHQPSRRGERGRRWLAGGAVAGCVALALTGCGSSGGGGAAASAKSRKAKAAKLSPSAKGTLTQWNWNTVADDPGDHALMPLVLKTFEKAYPGYKVTNTEMTLDEQNNKLPLALSTASSSPGVTETNEGYQSMGRLVTDKELLPLTNYVKLYGWDKIGDLNLQYNSFSSDGKYLGQGDVYGIPWTAAPLGIFYNKALLKKAGGTVPTSWASFTRDLALVKKAGITPMAYGSGQPTVYQPLHMFYEVADAMTLATTSINFVFHKGAKPSIDVPGYIKAATTIQDWSKAGYFPSGYTGMSGSQALSDFTSGKAAFFIEGEWYISSVQQALGSKGGFWVPPSTTGGPGEGYSIPVHSANPNAAAAFINIGLTPKFQEAVMRKGEVPVVAPSKKVLAKFPAMLQSATTGWQRTVQSHQLVPYLDYATPNYLNQIFASVQELQAGKLSPTSMIQQLQSDYTSYWSSK